MESSWVNPQVSFSAITVHSNDFRAGGGCKEHHLWAAREGSPEKRRPRKVHRLQLAGASLAEAASVKGSVAQRSSRIEQF
jgi:hypothetical protein